MRTPRTFLLLGALIVALCTPSAVFAQGPSNGSIEWSIHIMKTSDGPAPRRYVVLGEQTVLRMKIGVWNHKGPWLFGFERLADTLHVELRRDGAKVPLSTDVTAARQDGAVGSLDAGEGFDVNVVLAREDRLPFEFGHYELAIDMTQALRNIRDGSGGAWWSERSTTADVRHIEIKSIRSLADLSQYHDLEARALESERRFQEALPHLQQFAALNPGLWWAQGRLGMAYVRVNRFAEAVPQLERALPLWRRAESPGRIELIPMSLARCYVATGREAEARTLLEELKLSADLVATHLEIMRRNTRPR